MQSEAPHEQLTLRRRVKRKKNAGKRKQENTQACCRCITLLSRVGSELVYNILRLVA